MEFASLSSPLTKTLLIATAQGYHAKIENEKVLVEKICEDCGNPFWIDYNRREIAYCSYSCAVLASTSRGNKETATITIGKIKQSHQIKTDRIPTPDELKAINEQPTGRFRFQDNFQNWQELKEKAQYHNHRVKSIEFDGYEDVYSGTVDEFHNYFTGGWQTTTSKGKDKFLYVNQLNCGEIPLCPYDSCRLLAINLFSYVENPFTKEASFNFEKFGQHVQTAQRIMDDIIDLEIEKIDQILAKVNEDPEEAGIKQTERELWEKIRKTCVEGRRTGVGITAEGDMLASLGIQYGSDEAIDFSVKVHRTLAVNAYRSSVTMAKERGAFPIFDASREMKNPMIKRLKAVDGSLYDDMVKYGRRNIALLTIAPTGSVSLMTQTSSGIEPVFMVSYKRRRKVNPNDLEVNVTFIDEVGDHWEEYNVFHHKFMDWLKANDFDTDQVRKMDAAELEEIIKISPYYRATANDVDWVQKVKMQGAIQKWVDHSISVTVNVPAETSVDMVKQIYQTAWEHGCKGCTIYRDGSRSGVLVADDKKKEKKAEKETTFKEANAPKRPQKMECSVVRFRNNHEKWIAVVGLMDGRPYEIFTGRAEDTFDLPAYVSKGWVIKNKDENGKSRYDFQFLDKMGYRVTMEGLSRSFERQFWNYAKLISGVLRHGMPLTYVVHLVQGLNTDSESINTWKNGVARALKKFIAEGSKAADATCDSCGDPDGLLYKEGCLICKSCGHSKCG